ncbi:EpsG family protein [Paenibacillus alkaliterrae]|uniref:EpsG family protein n=1 Tax=Paenibacillus alkaliterrae TaxID=320909 RepID=UPI001F3A5A2C|nr:EpsG family protein [Paenibacillus alkaliterrae]MCF2937420.1 EpsG family protein [Paenibacillus alkaliterrae]
MTILWITLAFVFSVSLAARYFSVPAGIAPSTIIPNKYLAFIAALTLAAVSGLRVNIGDTFFYMHSYSIGDFSWESIADSNDIGFNILQMLLKQLSDEPQILILTTGVLTNLLIVMVLYKYTRLFELSVFLYITMGTFTVSMNGIRQFMAAAIIFAATKYVLEGKWKPYIAIVVFASLFHQSALIMIPIYFIVRREAWTKTTFILLSLAVLMVFGFNEFSELLFTAIKDTQYGHYEAFAEGGASYIRAIIGILPLLIAYFGRERLKQIFPNADVFVNMSLVGAVIMLISTQNWIFARMAIYFNLYHLILIAWLIKVFRKKDQKLIYLLLLIFYFLFYFYESVIALGLEYKSDYLIWPL